MALFIPPGRGSVTLDYLWLDREQIRNRRANSGGVSVLRVSGAVLQSSNPGEAVRAILLRIAESALADLMAYPDRAEDRVHDIRVGMKKFRALLGIAEPVLGRRRSAAIDRMARALKDGLGSQRDKDVQKALLGKLLGARAAEEAFVVFFARMKDSMPPNLPALLRKAEILRMAAEGLDLSALTREIVWESWADSYRAARRAMAACRRNKGDDALFHEWRKRTKTFQYRSSALGAPAGLLLPPAQELSLALGIHHDLAVLCQHIDACGKKAARAAEKKKRETARRALRLGAIIFEDKPSELLSQSRRRHGA